MTSMNDDTRDSVLALLREVTPSMLAERRWKLNIVSKLTLLEERNEALREELSLTRERLEQLEALLSAD